MGPERERKHTHGQYVEKREWATTSPKNASKESKELMEDLLAPRMKYKVIGSGKPKRVSKGPWESRIGKGPRKPKKSKWAKDAQEGNRTQELTNSVRKGPVNTLSHWEGNKQQAQRGRARLSQTTLQQE